MLVEEGVDGGGLCYVVHDSEGPEISSVSDNGGGWMQAATHETRPGTRVYVFVTQSVCPTAGSFKGDSRAAMTRVPQ